MKDEKEFRKSESDHRSLIHNAVYGIYRSSMAGRFLEVNPALVSMLGYESEAELLEKDLATDVYWAPADREHLVRYFRRREMIGGIEAQWKRRDGTPITVRLSGRPVRDGNGEAVSWEMIAEDVTERRILEDQLRQAQKLEGIGQLAGGIAHDFNNLLTAIGGYTSLVLESMEKGDANRPRLLEIHRAAERATTLTRQLLAFSRKQLLTPRVLSLNDVVRGMQGMLGRLIGENIELQTELADDLGSVHADHGQTEQVLLNLAVNARDAMPDGGVLTIRTTNVDEGGHCGVCDPTSPCVPRVVLEVRDDGCGMDDGILSRIFEPFFTTKDRERGTGLGLSTVYGIVKQSEGHVRAFSTPGDGSSFQVCLPRVEAAADALTEEVAGPVSAAGSGLILLVEDDDGVRALAEEILAEAGYAVISAGSGAVALALAERHADEIDLLLSDVVLPGRSGPEIAAYLRESRPDLPVVFMSGYTGEAIGRRLAEDHDTPLLAKPFTPTALEEIIRDALRSYRGPDDR